MKQNKGQKRGKVRQAMTIVQKAVLKHPDQRTQNLSLFRLEPSVYRWIIDGPGRPFDCVDYLSFHDGVKQLRVLVETDPAYVGVDLTIVPVELPPEERAARRVSPLCKDRDLEAIATIIREETAIDKLIEATNLLLAYEYPRRLQPKRPGLDLTWAGLVLSIIEALEIAQRQDLSNLKKQLTEGIKDIKIYSALPPQMEKPQ